MLDLDVPISRQRRLITSLVRVRCWFLPPRLAAVSFYPFVDAPYVLVLDVILTESLKALEFRFWTSWLRGTSCDFLANYTLKGQRRIKAFLETASPLHGGRRFWLILSLVRVARWFWTFQSRGGFVWSYRWFALGDGFRRPVWR